MLCCVLIHWPHSNLPLCTSDTSDTVHDFQEKRETVWGGANALVVPVGGNSEDLRYLKSLSLHLWLFGYELPGMLKVPAKSLATLLRTALTNNESVESPDTILVITEKELHVLTSQKKGELLMPCGIPRWGTPQVTCGIDFPV